jgi:hypothetical protein
MPPIPAERETVRISRRRLLEIYDALDAGIEALRKLSKTGSLRREIRESVLEELWKARQDKLFE